MSRNSALSSGWDQRRGATNTISTITCKPHPVNAASRRDELLPRSVEWVIEVGKKKNRAEQEARQPEGEVQAANSPVVRPHTVTRS